MMHKCSMSPRQVCRRPTCNSICHFLNVCSSIGRALQSLQQFFPLGFVAGFTEEGEHVFLVAFYTRLVEGVYAQQVTADAAGKLEEIEELTQIEFVYFRHMYHKVGNLAVCVCQYGAVHGALVHKIHGLSSQVVQTYMSKGS